MARWAEESDEELLIAAREDADAFSVFYRRYERPVLVFFRRQVGNPELAVDLAAEVFAAVLAALPPYRPDGAPVPAWLFAIARHKLARSRHRGRVEAAACQKLGMAPVVLADEDLRADRRARLRGCARAARPAPRNSAPGRPGACG